MLFQLQSLYSVECERRMVSKNLEGGYHVCFKVLFRRYSVETGENRENPQSR
jgi:hypothetical protein